MFYFLLYATVVSASVDAVAAPGAAKVRSTYAGAHARSMVMCDLGA